MAKGERGILDSAFWPLGEEIANLGGGVKASAGDVVPALALIWSDAASILQHSTSAKVSMHKYKQA